MIKIKIINKIIRCGQVLLFVLASTELIQAASEFDLINQTGKKIWRESLTSIKQSSTPGQGEMTSFFHHEKPTILPLENGASKKFIFKIEHKYPAGINYPHNLNSPATLSETLLKELGVSYSRNSRLQTIDLERVKSLQCPNAFVILKAGTIYGFNIEYHCPQIVES